MAHYTMLSQENCNYCKDAMVLLGVCGHTVDVYDVNNPDVGLIVAALKETNTVPQIFDSENNFIGGYTELKEHLG
jgi:glutaredoxin